MTKLLLADLNRLKKNKLFLGFAIIVFIYCLYKAISSYSFFANPPEYSFSMGLLEEMPIVTFLIAVATSFFVGTNFSDGVIRNKIATGSSRTDVYLSNVIVSMLISLILSSLFFISGIPAAVYGAIKLKIFLAYLLIGVVLSVSFSCIATFISMVTSTKAVASVICIALIAGMFASSSLIGDKLGEPEYYHNIDTVNGVPYENVSIIPYDAVLTYKQVPNENYIDGTKRKTLEIINELLPTSQFTAVADLWIDSESKNTYIVSNFSQSDKVIENVSDVFETANCAYSLCLSIFITALGVIIFKKKDLK